MFRFVFLFAAGGMVWAQTLHQPAGQRTTPPIINSVAPKGIARGITSSLTIDGLNLTGATGIYFSQPGIRGRVLSVRELPDLPETVRLGAGGLSSSIDLGPLPPRNRVTVEVDVDADAPAGPVVFRLLTPLGTTPVERFLIEPYFGESPDQEPNDTPDSAFATHIPTILVGTIERPGDIDYFRLEAKKGEQIVLDDGAISLGSSLDPVVTLFSSDRKEIRSHGGRAAGRGARFAHTFETSGTYFIRISDYQQSGGRNFFYRVKVGKFPLLLSAFPLGLPRGKTAHIDLEGYYLEPNRISVLGEQTQINVLPIRPTGRWGAALNQLHLSLGDEPEVLSAETNVTPSAAQRVTVPVTINGRLPKPAVENYFVFAANKGEEFFFEVNAHRLGSDLDSLIEVLDSRGNLIERATLRAVQETFTSILERDAVTPGIFFSSLAGLSVGDYLMIGEEIVRVEEIPAQSCLVVTFASLNGKRLTHFDTTAEEHGLDKPAYKIQIHPPGSQFVSNGLPIRRLYFRNDDGGPGFGKDSRLYFKAPLSGQYLARIRDLRGWGGETFPYRLTMRHPRPDFELSATPNNPNVPAGGRVPVAVSAARLDGFAGPIKTEIVGLPAGLRATTGIIPPGQFSTTLLLEADASAKITKPVPWKVRGQAEINNTMVMRFADRQDAVPLVSLMPPADITMNAAAKELILAPGTRTEVEVSVQRRNDFTGRVLVEARNLPPGVRVIDVGLNGVVIEENQDKHTFILEASGSAQTSEQPIYVSGRIETRSVLQNSYAAEPILLKVKTLQ